jgi:hypothetical protein
MGEATSAGTRGNDGNAPTPAVRDAAIELMSRAVSGHSYRSSGSRTP